MLVPVAKEPLLSWSVILVDLLTWAFSHTCYGKFISRSAGFLVWTILSYPPISSNNHFKHLGRFPLQLVCCWLGPTSTMSKVWRICWKNVSDTSFSQRDAAISNPIRPICVLTVTFLVAKVRQESPYFISRFSILYHWKQLSYHM